MSALAMLPKPQIIPPGTLDVFRLEHEVRQAAKAYRSSTMRLAYYGWRLRYQLANDWSPLGVRDEDEFIDSLGISYGTYRRSMRIGQALHNLKLEDLEQISVTNAELLMRVDQKLMLDYDWIGEAKRLSPDELCRKIVQRNRQMGSDQEPQAYYRCKVPFTAKAFIEQTVEAFRVANELGSTGEALELLIAEVHDRPSAKESARQYREYKSAGVGGMDAEDEEEVYTAEEGPGDQNFSQWGRDVPEQSGRTSGEAGEAFEGVGNTGRGVCGVPFSDAAGGFIAGLEGGAQ